MKVFLLIVNFFLFQEVYGQSNSWNTTNSTFILNGKIKGIVKGQIFLVHYDENMKRIVNNTMINDGKFLFTGNTNGFSDQYFLKLDSAQRRNDDSVNSVQILIENSNMIISLELGKFSKYKLRGCKSCITFSKAEKKYNLKSDSLFTNWKYQYVKQNPTNNLSPYLLYWMHSGLPESKILSYLKLFDAFDIVQAQSYYGLRTAEIVQGIKKQQSASGKIAPSFISKDLNGIAFNIDSFTEKGLVLLDFWASFCIPCRAENPKLKELYSKYFKNGFSIVAITDDVDEKPWKLAIEADKINLFTNLMFNKTSILKWDTPNGVANEYFVSSLPTLILLGKGRKILGYFNIDEVEKALKNYYKF